MIQGRWWERWPGRLEYELKALANAGISYVKDDAAFAAGVYRLHLSLDVEGRLIPLTITFPDLYPYFRFEVVAPDENLLYHQNPWDKNLCLIGRGTHSWNTDDTVADLIQSQVPEVLSTALSDSKEEVQGREQRQAEPVGEYFPYWPSMVLIEGDWRVPNSVMSGVLILGLAEDPKQPEALLQAAVLQVKTNTNQVLLRANQRLQTAYRTRQIAVRWVRFNYPVSEFRAPAFFELARRADPGAKNNRQHAFGDGQLQIWGVLFPEQVAWRATGEGWVFVCAHQRAAIELRSKPLLTNEFVKAKKGMSTTYYFSRAGRAGPQDLHLRAPELEPLRSHTVALFGLGCVGAPSAIELVRAGIGELRILDHDIVDPGTVSRWPLGLSIVGQYKAKVMAEWIRRDYPHTKVVDYEHRVGHARFGDPSLAPSDEEVLKKMTTGASLIYDATAETGVQHLLADLARQLGIPYIGVSGTYGGWGGKIIRICPGHTAGCWLCYKHWLDDGTIREPHEKRNDQVQPAGCGDPTFTGAGFDLAQVALTGVRTAVSTLCAGQPNGYPSTDWDLLTIDYRTADGALVPPVFMQHNIAKHPNCTCRQQ